MSVIIQRAKMTESSDESLQSPKTEWISSPKKKLLEALNDNESDKVKIPIGVQKEIQDLRKKCDDFQQEIDTMKKNSCQFNKDLESILSLRLSLMDLKKNMRNGNTENGEFEEILMFAKRIFLKRNIEELSDGVRKSFDFYVTCKDMIQNSDESLANVLKESLSGAQKALMIKLANYIENFNLDSMNQLKTKLKKIEKCDNGSKSARDLLQEIESQLNGNQTGDSVTDLVSKKSLNILSKAMICVASVLEPENSLEGFENSLPDLENFANIAKRDLEHERKLILGSGCQESNEPNPELIKLLGQIGQYVETELKTYQVNFNLREKLKEEIEKQPQSSKTQNLSNFQISSDEDNLSDVIHSGDDDIVMKKYFKE